MICNVRGVDNQDRAYTISKLSFTAADFTSRQKFNRASYCDDVSGPANESCLLDINQVNKNNGLIELRVTNAASCTTGIIWTSDAGASGSGETLTVKQPENDKAEYYTASCNSEKCKGGTWVNGPYTPSADNPCKGLDRDFSRTYTKDESVILQMSNCPGTVTWFKDPNRQDLICTLPTAAGKTTFTVGKLNATTLYYYNCQLKDGTICQSVGTAKIKGSSNGRVAVDNVSTTTTTTTGQIADTPSSVSGSNMRVASTVIEEVCSNSVSLATVMKEFYSKMLCQDVNLYSGDRTVAENYLDQLLSLISNSTSGTVIKSPSDKSGVIDKMVKGECQDAADLLAEPNNGVMVPVTEANDGITPKYSDIHDHVIESLVIPFSIHIQAFDPFKTFGFGFEGDGEDRKIGNGRDRYRVYAQANIQLQSSTFVVKGKTEFVATSNWFGKNEQPSETKSIVDLNSSSIPRKANLQILAWAGNDATMLREVNDYWEKNYNTDIGQLSDMNIDRDLRLSMEMTDSGITKTLKLNGEVKGEFFPSTDLFVRDKNGTEVTLGGSEAKINMSSIEGIICNCEAKNCGPFAYLGKPIYKNFDFTLSIKIENGIFKKVIDSMGNEWEIAAWNSIWLTKPTVIIIPK